MAPKRSYVGVVGIFGLMALTLYMAVAFPYTISFLKQTETTEIKSVIVIGRSGEKTPQPDSYFLGEEPPEELQVLGHDQLTNTGKERMFMLGKFLKLRYYHLLLDGDPRKIYARAADTDRALESAQALVSGLNPPKDRWIWSTTGDLVNWQPKAIHTTSAASDDLLSMEPNCPRLEHDRFRWKNSSKYQQLVNEFRHDLETLRSNTGLEFEDDLEMLVNIEESLRTRLAYKDTVPSWYTPTFASRLAHIADVTTENRYVSAEVQRLLVGRLLHEVVENINAKIRQNQQMLSSQGTDQLDDSIIKKEPNDQQQRLPLPSDGMSPAGSTRQQTAHGSTGGGVAGVEGNGPSVYIYMAGKQRLAALLNTLQIYSSLQIGSLLLIELHYDPINQVHFLRLFTVGSNSPNVFPEPLRVNPIACLDSRECSPQQFEQNIRHLMLDKASWLETCSSTQILQPVSPFTTTLTPLTTSTSTSTTTSTTPATPLGVSPQSEQPATMTTTTTEAPSYPTATDFSSTTSTANSLDKLDASLLVGPNIETQPESGNNLVEPDWHSATATTTAVTSDIAPATTTIVAPTTDTNERIAEVQSSQQAASEYQSNHLTRDIYYPEKQP